jgi:L-iditol 2-dehydrogenase
MKACFLTAYGKLEIGEAPVPEPGPGEVLCRIRAIAICGTDPEIIDGTHKNKGWPPRFPFIMGHEWSGEIVALGPEVNGFQVGDRVAGEAHKGCGHCKNCMTGNYTLCLNYGNEATGHRHYGFVSHGANCEYNAYSTKAIRKIPDTLSFPHAALLDTCGVALHGIDMIGVTPGGTTAVWGPGPIGLCAMQIVRALGSTTVIMVGRRHRLEVAGEIGADYLVDFEKVDPVRRIKEITDGVGVDEVQECSGANCAIRESIEAVRKGGKINLVGFYHDDKVEQPPFTSAVMNELTITGSRANPNVSDRVLNLFRRGAIKGDKVVTHAFPLEQYSEALESFLGRKDGAIKVVVEP